MTLVGRFKASGGCTGGPSSSLEEEIRSNAWWLFWGDHCWLVASGGTRTGLRKARRGDSCFAAPQLWLTLRRVERSRFTRALGPARSARSGAWVWPRPKSAAHDSSESVCHFVRPGRPLDVVAHAAAADNNVEDHFGGPHLNAVPNATIRHQEEALKHCQSPTMHSARPAFTVRRLQVSRRSIDFADETKKSLFLF